MTNAHWTDWIILVIVFPITLGLLIGYPIGTGIGKLARWIES